MQLGQQLTGIARCPHCSIANPLLFRLWETEVPIPRADGQWGSMWAAFGCTSCGSVVTAKGTPGSVNERAEIVAIYPEPKAAHADIPERPRRFLQQAFDTLHAPDAAAMLAGSAVDAMLKHFGLTDGSLYSRIDQAVEQTILTAPMAEWAHSVRLGSNRPRHADDANPHVTPEEAATSVEFAEALGQFLFVLAARITRGIERAKAADVPYVG